MCNEQTTALAENASSPRPPAPDDEHSAPERTTLDELRRRIDEVDRTLARLLAERTELAVEVGRRKRRDGAPLLDPEREAAVVRKAAARARRRSLDDEAVRSIYWRIIELSRSAQRDDGS